MRCSIWQQAITRSDTSSKLNDLKNDILQLKTSIQRSSRAFSSSRRGAGREEKTKGRIQQSWFGTQACPYKDCKLKIHFIYRLLNVKTVACYKKNNLLIQILNLIKNQQIPELSLIISFQRYN